MHEEAVVRKRTLDQAERLLKMATEKIHRAWYAYRPDHTEPDPGKLIDDGLVLLAAYLKVVKPYGGGAGDEKWAGRTIRAFRHSEAFAARDDRSDAFYTAVAATIWLQVRAGVLRASTAPTRPPEKIPPVKSVVPGAS